MDTNPTQSWYSVQPPPAPPQKSGISSDFDTFLKMLTAQIQNQDPLNPLESTDFAVQLATFSGVEQQTKTNQLLETLGNQFNLLGMTQLAAWVGQQARYAGPVAWNGSPVTLSPEVAPMADRVVLTVSDASGAVISREDIPPGAESHLWTGTAMTGEPLPKGTYKLAVENYRGEELMSTGKIESYATIREAQGGPAGNRLILEGGVTVLAKDITALRIAE